MKKDFITATPDTGGGNGTINVTASKNTGNARSTAISIAGSSCSKTISITQDKKFVLLPIIDLGFVIVGPDYGTNFKKRYTEYSKTLKAVFLYPKTALIESNYTYFSVLNLGAFRPEVVIAKGWFIDTIEIIVDNSSKMFTYAFDGSTFVDVGGTGGQLVYQNPDNYNFVKTLLDKVRSSGGEIIVTMKSSTLDPTICICDCIINS